jgi:hypothetical protein
MIREDIKCSYVQVLFSCQNIECVLIVLQVINGYSDGTTFKNPPYHKSHKKPTKTDGKAIVTSHKFDIDKRAQLISNIKLQKIVSFIFFLNTTTENVICSGLKLPSVAVSEPLQMIHC